MARADAPGVLAAHIARSRVNIASLGGTAQQGGGAHGLAALAVAALGHVVSDPSRLGGLADTLAATASMMVIFLAHSGRVETQGRHAFRLDGARSPQPRCAAANLVPVRPRGGCPATPWDGGGVGTVTARSLPLIFRVGMKGRFRFL
jgi:hypothetical protein